MNKTIFCTGACFGLLAVLLGAFGAHSLEKWVEPASVSSFDTGVRYQMYHALLLLVLGSVQQVAPTHKRWIYYLVTAGILLFSGSIYLLATNSMSALDFRVIGFATPIGGSLLALGWALLLYTCLKRFSNP